MNQQPQLGGRYSPTFHESFLVAFTIVRIHSQWIKSTLKGTSADKPLTDRLKSSNIQCMIYPGDMCFQGASGEEGGYHRQDDGMVLFGGVNVLMWSRHCLWLS